MEDQYVSFSAAWFTLSLVNAGLAQAKGRSRLNWWLVSLFVGPWPRCSSWRGNPAVYRRTRLRPG